MPHHHLTNSAPTRTTGSLQVTGRVHATTLNTGPQQNSNRWACTICIIPQIWHNRWFPNLVFHFCRKPLNCELGNTASVTQCHPTRAAAGGHRIMEAEGRSSGKSHLHQQTTPVCLTATNTITITINGTQASLEHLSTTPHYTLWRIRTLGTIITNKAQ